MKYTTEAELFKLTSKEALEMLRTTYNLPADIKANYGEIIEKDLEILEILKRHFYEEYQIPTGQHSLLFRLNGTPEYIKIKEWLENGK